MVLKLKPFDVPTRPQRMSQWGPVQLLSHLVVLGLFGYLSGTWLSLWLIGYMVIVEGTFAVREWRWQRYADRVEGTFVEIGEASSELSAQIERIAVEVETRTANAPPPKPATPQPNVTPGGVLYWSANSKGKH
jgi:hypothetical protein